MVLIRVFDAVDGQTENSNIDLYMCFYCQKTVTNNVRPVFIVTKQSKKDNLLLSDVYLGKLDIQANCVNLLKKINVFIGMKCYKCIIYISIPRL